MRKEHSEITRLILKVSGSRYEKEAIKLLEDFIRSRKEGKLKA
jgi:hypothetical protein